MSAEGTRRLQWVDDLRTMLVMLVVNMHACVTYSHVGGWYIKESPKPDQNTQVLFAVWQAHLQSFFMGLLFFIAGFFAVGALERRGAWGFIHERCFRLGLPSLFFMLVIQPLVVRGLLTEYYGIHLPWTEWYLRYLTSGQIGSGSGPMWFALALLGFSCAFVGFTKFFPLLGVSSKQAGPPQLTTVLVWIFAVSLCAYCVRGVQPMGTSILNFQLCYFPQYIAAFVTGIIASRHGWLEAWILSPKFRWMGWSTVIAGPLLLGGIIMVGGLPPEGIPNPYDGRWTLHSLCLATWEQLVGVGLSLGVMHWLATRPRFPGWVSQWLSRRTFGVYVLHTPILVGLTLLFRPISVGPASHVVLLTFTGLVVSYLAAELALRIPGLRRILS